MSELRTLQSTMNPPLIHKTERSPFNERDSKLSPVGVEKPISTGPEDQ